MRETETTLFCLGFSGICPLEARLVMVISIAPMLKMMVFSWDKTTSDHNQNGLRIQERGAMIKGIPFVHLANDLFWFNRSHLLLYLIHSILFHINTGRNHASIRTKPTLGLRFQWRYLY
ncbi:MLO-like protein isoform X2 [Helianthus annuus]|uniref:MLO-like protein isoform X2 n=1 Tax=Helianthus annuus TaxID=4232 RepID=UPI0016533168|nr:MLO-like protein isoform X2 [Helianthus annuus]